MVTETIAKRVKSPTRHKKCPKEIGLATLKTSKIAKNKICVFSLKSNEAAALGLRVCVVRVSGILVQTPTGNAQRNIADKLGKAPAVPVC